MNYYLTLAGDVIAADDESEDVHGATLLPERPTPAHYWDGTAWVLDSPRYLTDETSRIKKQAEAEIAALVGGYSRLERETWHIQVAEARASTGTTPFLDAMAAASGASKADLVANIIAKDDQFRAAVGEILGRQKAALWAL